MQESEATNIAMIAQGSKEVISGTLQYFKDRPAEPKPTPTPKKD
jgi:hypothetical protein